MTVICNPFAAHLAGAKAFRWQSLCGDLNYLYLKLANYEFMAVLWPTFGSRRSRRSKITLTALDEFQFSPLFRLFRVALAPSTANWIKHKGTERDYGAESRRFRSSKRDWIIKRGLRNITIESEMWHDEANFAPRRRFSPIERNEVIFRFATRMCKRQKAKQRLTGRDRETLILFKTCDPWKKVEARANLAGGKFPQIFHFPQRKFPNCVERDEDTKLRGPQIEYAITGWRRWMGWRWHGRVFDDYSMVGSLSRVAMITDCDVELE